jgi:NAD+ synthase
MTGYFTKFGDGSCDLLPIGDLLKTQVKELARKLNIPQDLINKTPSAGLWQGQTDEAELGISYSELDKILAGLERSNTRGLSLNKLNKVKAKIKKTEHKRQGPKICYL